MGSCIVRKNENSTVAVFQLNAEGNLRLLWFYTCHALRTTTTTTAVATTTNKQLAEVKPKPIVSHSHAFSRD